MQKVLREQQILIDYAGTGPSFSECKEPSQSSSLPYCNSIFCGLRSNLSCKGTVGVVMHCVCNMYSIYVVIGADQRDGSR